MEVEQSNFGRSDYSLVGRRAEPLLLPTTSTPAPTAVTSVIVENFNALAVTPILSSNPTSPPPTTGVPAPIFRNNYKQTNPREREREAGRSPIGLNSNRKRTNQRPSPSQQSTNINGESRAIFILVP